ncbi:hypothetical protein OTAKU_00400 [Serratia phage vB_SmaM-Otaku]|uniref:Uncharacterized protein n=1 Tax=Serratia phage vB_SmaM-Otaku TaxID=2932867 RepID=A0AAE9HEN0_9CAUD|nr:hypothetical protein PF631_gp40 [Serratia phage vB_SmaM-Otaku]UPU16029.1 hypothetical protein OTAKU_00400 [Serratia phage vB_SmaM-Otaku]
MTTEYESLNAERDALAVENAELKATAADLRRKAFNGRRNSHNCGPLQYSDLCESIIEATKVETLATDAALAAIQAQGVEKFAEHMLTLANDPTYSTASHRNDLRDAGAKARNYAAELREIKKCKHKPSNT